MKIPQGRQANGPYLMRLAFFTKEALRALRRNAAPSFAAAATVLITALVLGVFIPVVQSATGKTNEVRNRIQLELELKDASKKRYQQLKRQITEIPHVKSVIFRSKQENLRRFRKRVGDEDLTKLLPKNPLPSTFVVKLDDASFVAPVTKELSPKRKGKKLERFSPLIVKVLNRTDESKKILSFTSTIKLLLGILTAVLVLASLMLVANTIRLSIFARRREIEVMQLVGATNWFIRWPFIIEGLIVGAFGSAAAILILWILKATVVSDTEGILSVPDTVSFALLGLILLAAGTLVSAVGSGLTIRRFLKT